MLPLANVNTSTCCGVRSSATRFRVWQRRGTRSSGPPSTWAMSSLYVGQQCADLCHGHGLCVAGHCRSRLVSSAVFTIRELNWTERTSEFFFKSVNIWQSYQQERDYVLAGNFAKYSPILIVFFSLADSAINLSKFGY